MVNTSHCAWHTMGSVSTPLHRQPAWPPSVCHPVPQSCLSRRVSAPWQQKWPLSIPRRKPSSPWPGVLSCPLPLSLCPPGLGGPGGPHQFQVEFHVLILQSGVYLFHLVRDATLRVVQALDEVVPDLSHEVGEAEEGVCLGVLWARRAG